MPETTTITFGKKDWRARFLISSNAVFTDLQIFQVQECAIRVIIKGENYFLIEIYVKRNSFEDNILLLNYVFDVANEFLSQVSALTYAPAKLLKFISICPTEVTKGEIFPMILSDISIKRKKVSVEQKDFVAFNSGIENYSLLILLNTAINSDSLDQKFINYFAALDALAILETKERVITECSNCGFKIEGLPATSRYLKSLFQKHDISSSDYNSIREIRNKIAHGGGKRNELFYKEVNKYLMQLETVCFDEVTKKIGLTPLFGLNIFVDKPVWEITGKKVSNRFGWIPASFKIIESSFIFNAQFNLLKNAIPVTDPKELAGTFGPPGNFNSPSIPIDAWPY